MKMRSEADFLMHEENEREEYSGEMILGRHRKEDAAESAQREQRSAFDLEAEVAEIFSAEAPMPIPMRETMPKQNQRKQAPVIRTPREKSGKVRQEPKHEPPKEITVKKRGTARYAMAMLVLLMISVGVCALSVRIGMKYASASGASPDGQGSTQTPAGEEKIIFVHSYDDASGVLSVPEIYATYSDSVVSVRTQGKNGSGVGSGFFVREDGYIATVAHVVEGAEHLSVLTKDGVSYEAHIVSSNAMTDLALLKIAGQGFHAVEFGASGELLVGERVIAIGTPASTDYAGTLCTGEVSYALRTVKMYDDSGHALQKKMKLLQTNAPVNPGNSGCPLFDERGRVVGIVTMRLGEDYDGIGFAIPSDGASAILQAMMRGESPSEELLSLVSVGMAELGIVGEASSVDGIAGVRIVQFSDSGCDAAIKLRRDDLIIQLDKSPIATLDDLRRCLQEKNPGEGILVTVLRSGQRLTFEVILEKS